MKNNAEYLDKNFGINFKSEARAFRILKKKLKLECFILPCENRLVIIGDGAIFVEISKKSKYYKILKEAFML